VDAGRGTVAAVCHVVHVRRAEGHRLTGEQAALAETPAARYPVLLYQAALGDHE